MELVYYAFQSILLGFATGYMLYRDVWRRVFATRATLTELDSGGCFFVAALLYYWVVTIVNVGLWTMDGPHFGEMPCLWITAAGLLLLFLAAYVGLKDVYDETWMSVTSDVLLRLGLLASVVATVFNWLYWFDVLTF